MRFYSLFFFFFFFPFSLYRDEKAPTLNLNFNYVVLHEFKPFGGADSQKWKLNSGMSVKPTLCQ